VSLTHTTQKTNSTTAPDQLVISALGLVGEAGEYTEHVKKYLERGVPLDHIELVKELGDTMYYLTLCCMTHEVDFDYLLDVTANKLRKRGLLCTDSKTTPGT
jgi:NTP pyrophosphatase (non-canonical NTP hydrolase)